MFRFSSPDQPMFLEKEKKKLESLLKKQVL